MTTRSTAGWTRVGQQLGSNPGGVFADESGRIHYVKIAKSADHARNEVLASRLYALAGIECVRVELVETPYGIGTASEWLTGADQIFTLGRDNDAMVAKIRAGFAVDVWLANWDVAGLVFDNIVTVSNNPVRVDTGGCLLFRAMGTPKGSMFGTEAREYDTLRDPSMAPEASRLFATITREQILESAVRVAMVTPEQIAAAVDSVGFDEQTRESMTDTLIARREYVTSRAKGE